MMTNIVDTFKITKLSGNDLLFKNNNILVNQNIISLKNNKIYYNKEASKFIEEKHKYEDLITISPGGFKGFYLLGILTYIKEKYNTQNLIYSGASAGSWNSLFMCYKGEPLNFVYNLIDNNIIKSKSISELEYLMKYKILSQYKDNDFDLDKLYIGVTTLKNFMPSVNIFTDFENLEDAINCCIASSHIPLISGGVTNKYKNIYSFDGGFSNYPYINKTRLLHVSPSMWDEIHLNEINKNNKNDFKYKEFLDTLIISKNNLYELLDNGYQDANKNKEYLKKYFKLKSSIYDE
jgi:hypothetical protein